MWQKLQEQLLVILVIVVVVIGGIGSISGALIAALLVGFVDTFGKVLLPQVAGMLAAAKAGTVVVGDEVHPSVTKALGVLGLGRDRVVRVPVDAQGRMRADALPRLSGPSIVCLQAGNVNSGACDPFAALIEQAHRDGAWVHVDGAFGLWAAAAPARSWATES